MSITSVQNLIANGAILQPVIFEGKTRQKSVRSKATPVLSDAYVNSNDKIGAKKARKASATINGMLAKYTPEIFMEKYLNQKIINNALQTNPIIKATLLENGLEPKIYMENIRGNSRNHFKTTRDAIKTMDTEISNEDSTLLFEAALLHDIGKAFIPSSILNKPARLTDNERKIVDLHANLGAEILKTTDIDKKVIEAVRLHHTDYDLPEKRNNSIAQILSIADVYSALKEERPYKPKLSEEKVKNIMENDKKLNPHFLGKLTKRGTSAPIFA